jgi:ribosomal protein S18 acetylase RimI-like enzyme
MSDVTVEILDRVDDETAGAIADLIPQLSSSADRLTPAALAGIVAHEACSVFVARVDGRLVGALTLAVFPIPTGLRAWIEDVVVDEAARGHGVGAALNTAALDHARSLGAVSVDLTSRPSREAANRLYQRLGFERRETNVYRMELE